jgi:putative salt-induced outer membrane protein
VKRQPALAATVIACLAGAPFSLAQDTTTTTATTPAQLLEALRAAGYDVPDITSVNEDGSVSITLPTDVAESLASVEAGEASADEETAEAVARAAEAAEEPAWDFRLTLGFSFSDGNTENSNFFGSFLATHETEAAKFVADAAYFYAQDSGDESENRATAGARQDWYLDEHWIVFADARWDYDEFKSWRHRLSGHVGVGYRLINEDDFKLTPRVGIGVAKEFGSDRNEIIPEGLAGLDLEWNISENQSLVASTYYYPDLSDLGEFRWVNTAGWNIKINEADGLSLTFGFLHEYESQVDAGDDRNDFKLFGGLTFDF